jgi:hypothetical protein
MNQIAQQFGHPVRNPHGFDFNLAGKTAEFQGATFLFWNLG